MAAGRADDLLFIRNEEERLATRFAGVKDLHYTYNPFAGLKTCATTETDVAQDFSPAPYVVSGFSRTVTTDTRCRWSRRQRCHSTRTPHPQDSDPRASTRGHHFHVNHPRTAAGKARSRPRALPRQTNRRAHRRRSPAAVRTRCTE